MKILEAPFCNETFHYVKTIEDIKNSPSNTTLVFHYCDTSLELYAFCKENSIPYAVIANDIKELVFCHNLGAKYIFCDTIKKAKKFQQIAENYLMDTKIVYLADNLEKINEIADYGIDAIKLKEKK